MPPTRDQITNGAPTRQDIPRPTIRLFNTLTRRIEPLTPLKPPRVTMYSCGPTVYRYVHIGNLRTYLMADWLRRTLTASGYDVRHVKNITDVGHMRQDQVDRGEDKMIAAALAEGKTPAEIAAFYTDAFLMDEQQLGILPADVFPRATEHVPQMIALIGRLLASEQAYLAGGNVYFDVSRFPGYGELSGNLDDAALIEAVRVEADPLKRGPRDFALWKAAEPGRLVKWNSPWGPGFPGWHIECSAMAMHHLGEQLDLHTGGVDNIFPHHEDERAQSEAATGKTFARLWVHAQHLLVDGLKMAKSTGNAYTLAEITERGFEPADFRYLCLTVGYRSRLNFTWTALRAARRALARLRRRTWDLLMDERATDQAQSDETRTMDSWRERFWNACRDNLRLSSALASTWDMLRDERLSANGKRVLLDEFDGLLGLGLLDTARAWPQPESLPPTVSERLARREQAREQGNFKVSDTIRHELEAEGYDVRDTRAGPRVLPRTSPDRLAQAMSRAEQVPSLLAASDACEFSVCVYNTSWPEDTKRCVSSLLRYAGASEIEIIVLDGGTSDSDGQWLTEDLVADPRVRRLWADHVFGEAEARNATLRASRGRICVVVDGSVEATGDIFTPLRRVLSDPSVVVAGPYGLITHDLRSFTEDVGPDVDAIEGYLMAFPRAALRRVGLMDPRYRFYRNLDIDFSFTLRQKGVKDAATDPDRAVVVALPVVRHEHRGWEALGEDERAKRSKKNFDIFLKKWHHHTHLMTQPPASSTSATIATP